MPKMLLKGKNDSPHSGMKTEENKGRMRYVERLGGGGTSMGDGKWTWMHAGEIDGESVCNG